MSLLQLFRSYALPVLVGAGFLGALAGAGCTPRKPKAAVRPLVTEAISQRSATCQRCHEDIHKAWLPTDHANANHAIRESDRPAFAGPKHVSAGGSEFDLDWKDGKPVMIERREGAQPISWRADMILGSKPLWQPLVSMPGNRWQPTDIAYDPAKKDWFNVFGEEHRKQGEWGHWTGRGMNWNSMCAQCHMTGYEKDYDTATDAYRSHWVEHGIGCIQCHGAMERGHDALPPNAPRKTKPGAPFFGDRTRMMETCAPCHARNEQLTPHFEPGDSYFDHYRVTLPLDPAVYYQDGQQKDEDFNWTSVLLSRMVGRSGVTCFDCHDPHSTKTLLPATNNQLCLRCHGAPGVNKAPVIDPLAHSHHKPDSTGNQCVTCHMPTTNYMQRAPRHDHGWLKPDPLMTKELGIPNACSRCHTDQTVDWAIQKADEWYGQRLNSYQRARTRAVAAAQQGKPDAAAQLASALRVEDIPAWRATLLELAMPYVAQSPELAQFAEAARKAKHPLERSAAVRVLSQGGNDNSAARDALKDPVRLVRLDAEWALSPTLTPNSPERAELDAYLGVALDQPSGRLRLGQDYANRGMLADAEREMRTAVRWDHGSSGIEQTLAMVLHAAGKTVEAAEAFMAAAKLPPADGESAYRAGLCYAETDRMADAETALKLAVEQQPGMHRAWYNLGLLQAQTNRLADARTSLEKAEALAPTVADYPYALATVLLRQGDREQARAAAQRALAIQPEHPGARAILQGR